jgi:hypothetical protein
MDAEAPSLAGALEAGVLRNTRFAVVITIDCALICLAPSSDRSGCTRLKMMADSSPRRPSCASPNVATPRRKLQSRRQRARRFLVVFVMGSQTVVEKCGKGDQYVRFISIVETDQGRWPTLQSGLEFPEIDRYQGSRDLHPGPVGGAESQCREANVQDAISDHWLAVHSSTGRRPSVRTRLAPIRRSVPGAAPGWRQ